MTNATTTLTFTMLVPTAIPAPFLHAQDGVLEEAKYYLELFGIVVATIILIALAIGLVPLVTEVLIVLFLKFRERRERHRAAEDEEDTTELAALSGPDFMGGEEGEESESGGDEIMYDDRDTDEWKKRN